VSLVRASAEQLPFSEVVFDTLVMTWTLCSIPNASAALHRMWRVLKPGGQMLFVEHGLSPESRIALASTLVVEFLGRSAVWGCG
jgi:ubiquinone/menaquinone biosynthesis C-methylase UbiE